MPSRAYARGQRRRGLRGGAFFPNFVEAARPEVVPAQIQRRVVVPVPVVEEVADVRDAPERVARRRGALDARVRPEVEALLLAERLPVSRVGVPSSVLVEDDARLVERAVANDVKVAVREQVLRRSRARRERRLPHLVARALL